jgi:hypothetical protein
MIIFAQNLNFMREIDFYTALKTIIRQDKEPFTIIFTKLLLDKNEGGAIRVLENQVQGPLKKNHNQEYMIGLKDIQTDEVRHIYIHTILEVVFKGIHYKLILN